MIYINNEDKLENLDLKKSFMIFDFDRTITTPNSPTSWSVIENNNLLSERYRSYSLALYNFYRKFEISNDISYELKQELMVEWMSSQLDLLSMCISKESFELLLQESSNIKFREGIDKLFKKMYRLNVPIIVISAGLGNVVKESIKINNCLYDNVNIISNMLVYNNGFRIDRNLVNSTNKTKLSISEEIKMQINDKKIVILFGDQISDLTCLENFEAEQQISIGFLTDETSKYFLEYTKHFDVVCTQDENYNNIRKILKKRR